MARSVPEMMQQAQTQQVLQYLMQVPERFRRGLVARDAALHERRLSARVYGRVRRSTRRCRRTRRGTP